MEFNIFEIAKGIEFNAKAEAQSILDYTEFLRIVDTLSIDGVDKEFIKDTISEIISDELNHQEKLKMLYTMLTSIKANKD